MRANKQGFTLLEILILVAIIGIVVSIATPYFVRYAKGARKSACITNMKKIEGAVMMAKMTGVPAPGVSDLIGPALYLKKMPTCPNNDAPYTVLDPPACPASDATHIMPPHD